MSQKENHPLPLPYTPNCELTLPPLQTPPPTPVPMNMPHT
jgi:hypothetical protein